MRTILTLAISVLLIGFIVVSCDNSYQSTKSSKITADEMFNSLNSATWKTGIENIPGPLTNVNLWDSYVDFWPYTGENFAGNPQDPINLIFYGNADPRQIREALLALDGDRTAYGMPDEPPFNNQWEDAIAGDIQVGYGSDKGWTGGAVQLACGDYGPVRFHMRLFRLGEWTIANVHFELQIPGTTDHQVLSWKLARDFVMADMIRTGLLGDNPTPTGPINEPNFRSIPNEIYNMLPVELRAHIEGHLGDVSEDVPIKGSGEAIAFYIIGDIIPQSDTRTKDLIIDFNQTIPKPFCASSPYEFLNVTGPVYLHQTTRITQSGKYVMQFHAKADLSIIPINILTGEQGETLVGKIRERDSAKLGDYNCIASSSMFQKLLPSSNINAGWMFKRLRVNTRGRNNFEEKIHCSDEQLNKANGNY